MAGLTVARMSGGSELQAAGPACEKARSPNLVHSRGVTYLLLEADRRPVRVAALLDVRMTSTTITASTIISPILQPPLTHKCKKYKISA